MHTATLCLLVALIAMIVCTHATPIDNYWRQTEDNNNGDKRGSSKPKFHQFHHIGLGKRTDTSVSSENRAELQKLLVRYFLQVLDSEMSRQSNYPDQQEMNGLLGGDM